jgi:transposase
MALWTFAGSRRCIGVARKPYPTDVKDDEWDFVVPHLTLMREDAPQREHDLREIFNALRWIVRAGAPWRMIPNDLPPWAAVYQQVQRWISSVLGKGSSRRWCTNSGPSTGWPRIGTRSPAL